MCLSMAVNNVIIMDKSFIHCSSPRGELQSSGDQYHRDGSGLQVRIGQLSKCLPETTWFAEFFVFVCLLQRCPSERIVPASVPLRERPVGCCALCFGHRPGF